MEAVVPQDHQVEAEIPQDHQAEVAIPQDRQAEAEIQHQHQRLHHHRGPPLALHAVESRLR